MFRRISTITHEIADLGLGGGGFKSLFVDQSDASASDSNPGTRSAPFKTINGALVSATPLTNIYINGGNYVENVVVPTDKIQLMGVARIGSNKVSICPATGSPLTINGRECKVSSLEVISQDNHAIVTAAADIILEKLHIKVNDASCAIYANNSNDLLVENCSLDGNNSENAVGVYLGGTSARAIVKGCHIGQFGSGVTEGGVLNGYGIGIANTATFAQVLFNWIYECFEGVHLYGEGTPLKGHALLQNKLWGISSKDINDLNDPSISGINIRGNSFLYSTYLVDEDHDGIFDGTVQCGSNYDYAPVAHAFGSTPFTPRRVV